MRQSAGKAILVREHLDARAAKALPRCAKWKRLRSTGTLCEKSRGTGRLKPGQSLEYLPRLSSPALPSGAFFYGSGRSVFLKLLARTIENREHRTGYLPK